MQCLRLRRERLRALKLTVSASCSRQLRKAFTALRHHCNAKRMDSKWRILCRRCVVSARSQAFLTISARARPRRLCRLVLSRWKVLTWRHGRVVRRLRERTVRRHFVIRVLLQRLRRRLLSRGWHRWLNLTHVLGQRMRLALHIMALLARRQGHRLLTLRRKCFDHWRLATILDTRHGLKKTLEERVSHLRRTMHAFGCWKQWTAKRRAQRRRLCRLVVSMIQLMPVRRAWRVWITATNNYHSYHLKCIQVCTGFHFDMNRCGDLCSDGEQQHIR